MDAVAEGFLSCCFLFFDFALTFVNDFTTAKVLQTDDHRHQYIFSHLNYSLRLEDLDRISMLMKMEAADLVNSISQSGHQYAMTHSSSSLSEVNRLREVILMIGFLSHLF